MATRQFVADQFAQVKAIIDATNQQPTIVDPKSKFVVVTYWWGRSRLNRNTARPCIDFYESLLEKPVYLLTPANATPDRFAYAILNNTEYIEFLQKKIQDYYGVLRAYQLEGNPVSTNFQQRSEKDLLSEILKLVIKGIAGVLPEIRTMQEKIVERAELEETFERRLEAQLTSKAQLATIKAKLQELKEEKTSILTQIKQKMGDTKTELATLMQYQDPITYDAMIENWEIACRNAGCNYMAVEYNEFTRPGGYQLAINAKPRFIQKALELCGGRGVLYIDGDMTINRYPSIFDREDIDMAARGWNIDPRSSYRHNESILVDPYVFETSGGTMFFGTTQESHLLLQRWIEVSERFSQWGKADDRILSLVFNTYRLLLPMRILQLPVEYLWLTLDYDDSIEPELHDRDAIFIEHPECLTSEDTAAGQGASSSRTPKFYGAIEYSYPRSEDLHEAVLFPTEADAETFRPYLDYVGNAVYFDDVEDESLEGVSPFRVTPFAEGLGTYQAVADANLAAVQTLPPLPNTQELVLTEANIPRILQALLAGVSVVYMPTTASSVYKSSLETTRTKFPNIEFMFVNTSRDIRPIFYFQSEFDPLEPAFFRAGSRPLVQLLSMCRDFTDLQKLFQHGYQFLSQIRTHFLKRYRGGSRNLRTPEDMMNSNMDSNDALNFLYGVSISRGGRRTYKRRNPRRKTRRG